MNATCSCNWWRRITKVTCEINIVLRRMYTKTCYQLTVDSLIYFRYWSKNCPRETPILRNHRTVDVQHYLLPKRYHPKKTTTAMLTHIYTYIHRKQLIQSRPEYSIVDAQKMHKRMRIYTNSTGKEQQIV